MHEYLYDLHIMDRDNTIKLLKKMSEEIFQLILLLAC